MATNPEGEIDLFLPGTEEWIERVRQSAWTLQGTEREEAYQQLTAEIPLVVRRATGAAVFRQMDQELSDEDLGEPQ